jgi:L-rhamnose isomerase/sugar isomerase
MLRRIESSLIKERNEELYKDLKSDYDALGEKLGRDGIDIETFTKAAEQYHLGAPVRGELDLLVFHFRASLAIFMKSLKTAL